MAEVDDIAGAGAGADEAAAAAAAAAGGGDGEGGDKDKDKDKGGGDPGKTVLETGGDGKEGSPAPSKFPDTWRQDMAAAVAGASEGEAYDKELKRLERMSSPADAYKSFREMERKMSSGELRQKTEFPAEGTDTDKAKWRQDNGIPPEPKGYLEGLNGLVIGEADQPLVDEYLKTAHEQNLPPEAIRSSLDWYFKAQEKAAEEMAARDAAYHDRAVEALREEMGPDYKRNFTDLNNWLSNGPEGLKDNLFGARLADGTLLGDNPAALSWLVSQMREINPLSTVVPNDGPGGMASVEAEIAEIKQMIATEPQKYWGDKAKQERYGKLLAARDKQMAKAG